MRDDRFPDLPDGRLGSPANGHPAGGAPRNGASRHGSGRPTVVAGVLSTDDDTDGDAPIDLVAVQADDELVTTIGARPAGPLARHLPRPFPGGRDPGGPARDDHLVAMLAAWRAEIDADPIPELIDLDTAVAAVVAGVQAQESTARRRRSGRLRHLAPLAAAAAIIVATVTGVGLGSQNAVPGDTLWPIQKVVDPERAESVEAKVEVESRLEKVRTALKEGDTATAAQELEAIRTQIPAVRGQDGQPQLAQEQEFLAAKLADTPPNTPADLTTPPKSNPAAHPTGVPGPSPGSGVPPVDPAVTAPSASQSVTDPQSTDPDVRSGPVDQGSGPAAPVGPDAKDSVLPKPSPPAADVTSSPEAPKPNPQPEPPGSGAPGGTEGAVDPSTDPGPVVQPPPSGANDGTSAGEGAGTSSSDTTTASGSSAGASLETTATDTTS